MWGVLLGGLGLILFASGAYASDESLRDLVSTKVYSASKKQEDPHNSPSALYVITEDDLRQMGVRHVADALRTVPGLQVAKISSNKWMVASRGFGEQFSNKLLVLLDGRPIYTTLFSGVLWFQQDVPIADIKQIEVIRGPGATLWGSNAVNGVINIITKSSRDTIGTKISTTAGFTDRGSYQALMEAQYGTSLKEGGTFRSTAKLRKDPTYESALGLAGYNDDWENGSLNFRYDSAPNKEKSYLLSGAVFRSDADETYTLPTLTAPFVNRKQGRELAQGAYLQGEWTHETSNTSSTTLRSYVDLNDVEYADYKPRYLNAGAEAQRNFIEFGDWETVIGAGYKVTLDSISNSPVMMNNPSTYDAHFVDAFFQTKIPLIDRKLFTLVGNKFESSTYDDFAFLPNVKLEWEPDPLITVWTSWAQSQRIPSRNTYHLTSYVRGTPGGYIALIPSEDFKPEKLTAYEAGVRLNPLPGLMLDSAVFYNHYNDLRTFDPGPSPGAPIAGALFISNSGYADNKGLEISATYQTTPELRLIGSYSYTDLDFKADPGVVDVLYLTSGTKWAQHSANIRAAYSLSEVLTYNASAYYYSEQPAMRLPAYVKVDTNLIWQLDDQSELQLGVDNVTDNLHPEYSAALLSEPTEVPRLYYLTLKLSL